MLPRRRSAQIAAELLDALAGLFESPQVLVAYEIRKAGPKPNADPCTTATPSASSSSVTKSSSVWSFLPDGVVLPMAPAQTDRRRTRLPAVGQSMPLAWFSIATTRSRRSLNILLFASMNPCGPFRASTAAHCEIGRRIRCRLRLDRCHRLDQLHRARRHSRCASRSYSRPLTRRSL